MRKHKIQGMTILSVALLLRLVVFLIISARNPTGMTSYIDCTLYRSVAENLLSAGTYRLDESLVYADMPEEFIEKKAVSKPVATCWVTPGYPFFIASIFWALGSDVRYIVLAQVLIGSLTALVTWYLGSALLGARVGVVAGLMVACDWISVSYTSMLMSETLFTLMFVLSLYYLFIYLRGDERTTNLITSASLLGLAALTRPIGVFFIVCIVPLIIGYRWKRKCKYYLIPTLLYLGVYLLSLAPWLIRNHLVLGRPYFCSVAAGNALFIEAASVWGQWNTQPFRDAQIRLSRIAHERLVREGKALAPMHERASVYFSLAREVITAHPIQYLKARLMGMVRLLLSPGHGEFMTLFMPKTDFEPAVERFRRLGLVGGLSHLLSQISSLLLPLAAMVLLQQLLGIIGAIRLIFLKRGAILLILAVPILYFLLFSGALGSARFRVPLVPFLAILAGSSFISPKELEEKDASEGEVQRK